MIEVANNVWEKIDEVKTIKQSNPYGTGTAEHVFKYFAKDQQLVDEVMAWCQRAAETRAADRDVLSREALAKSMNELTASIKALAKTVPDVVPDNGEGLKAIDKAMNKAYPYGYGISADDILTDICKKGADQSAKGGEVFESGTVIMTSEYKKEITAEGTKVFQKAENGEWILIDSEKRE